MLSGNAIRHARLPSRPDGRGAVERWLAGREPGRYGLPPDAIVLVRGVRARWAEVAGGGDQDRGDALAAVIAGAARPALGGGAVGSAAAVWFGDDAELLACLARDAVAGPLHAHWWWPTLLRDGTDMAAAIAHWIRSARAVPRAVARLRSMASTGRWFEHWDASSRLGLLAALAQHHPLATAVVAAVAGDEGGTARSDPMSVPEAVSAAGPWRDADRRGHGLALSPPARLQALCLALSRQPSAAADLPTFLRSLAFDADDARFVASVSGPSIARGMDAGFTANRRRQVPDEVVATQARDGRDSVAFAAPGTFSACAEHTAPPESIAPAPFPSRDGPPERAESFVQPASAAAIDRAATAPSITAATVIDSAHAGLLFVVNAALHFGLYGDFSQPQHRGIAVSPYRFLHDVGRAIGRRRFLRDPLAAWLAAEAAAADPDAAGGAATPTLAIALLRARLALALGLADPRRLAATLLRIRGRIRVTADRIDVVIALHDLPLAVRLAGLDRDPGWLPAAGRDLRFHFDA